MTRSLHSKEVEEPLEILEESTGLMCAGACVSSSLSEASSSSWCLLEVEADLLIMYVSAHSQ